jgi:hypothetical protein
MNAVPRGLLQLWLRLSNCLGVRTPMQRFGLSRRLTKEKFAMLGLSSRRTSLLEYKRIFCGS